MDRRHLAVTVFGFAALGFCLALAMEMTNELTVIWTLVGAAVGGYLYKKYGLRDWHLSAAWFAAWAIGATAIGNVAFSWDAGYTLLLVGGMLAAAVPTGVLGLIVMYCFFGDYPEDEDDYYWYGAPEAALD